MKFDKPVDALFACEGRLFAGFAISGPSMAVDLDTVPEPSRESCSDAASRNPCKELDQTENLDSRP
jgi:hypothetical protein